MSYNKKSCKITPGDRWFSIYIRLLNATDDGWCVCCTCGKWFHWRDITCGHFQKRHHAGTRFNEQNCAAQCRGCNSYNDGQQYLHGLYIDNKYGKGTAKKLVSLARAHGKIHKHDEKTIAAFYRGEAREIAKQKGLVI